MAKKNPENSSKNQKDSSKPQQKQNKKADMLEMNLAEDEIVHYFSWKRGIFLLAASVLLAAMVLGGVYYGLNWWGEKRVEKNEYFIQQTKNMDKKIKNAKEKAVPVFIFKKKLELAQTLLKNHVYWTHFFEYLEDNTLDEVHYSKLTGDLKGEYRLPVIAADYNLIDSQVKRMRKAEPTKMAEVTKAEKAANLEKLKQATSSSEVKLKMDLEVDEKMFLRSSSSTSTPTSTKEQ